MLPPAATTNISARFRLSSRTGVSLREQRGLDFHSGRPQAPKIVTTFPGECAMKRSMMIFLLVAALAFAVAADTKGIGTLAGTVIGPSGKPVAGARVTSQGADGTMPKSTLTNSDGRFFFPQLENGYYDVRAYHSGAWTNWKHNVEVKIGKQTEVKLQLPSQATK